MPDVTSERLEKKHVLDELKSDIKKLKDSKGYEDKEILKFLNDAGFQTLHYVISRTLLPDELEKKNQQQPKKITGVDEEQRTQNSSTAQNPDASGPQY